MEIQLSSSRVQGTENSLTVNVESRLGTYPRCQTLE